VPSKRLQRLPLWRRLRLKPSALKHPHPHPPQQRLYLPLPYLSRLHLPPLLQLRLWQPTWQHKPHPPHLWR
jgi:hypothetical protein